MEFENESLEKGKKDKIPFALRNKKTGEVLFCTVVANFTEFAANNYESKTELKDKNGVIRKIFFPMSNTCDLGKIKLKYEKSEESMKLLDLIGISRYKLEARWGWKSSLKDKKNIYDEYGIHEDSNGAFVGNIVSGLYQLNADENNPANKNLDLSYGGWRDWDNQSTASNDFWHRFYEKICTEEKYQWMKFYRNLNMTLSDSDMTFEENLFCHGVLTTALSNGNLETLQKEIFDFGHFVGPDTYIYDFNEIYPNDIDRYKNYLGFILWNKLPDKKTNKADYAKEILNYISEKNQDLKTFITTNQVQYNNEDERFEMITSGKNTHDANAWIYSTFFPVPSEDYIKYSFFEPQYELSPISLSEKGKSKNIYSYSELLLKKSGFYYEGMDNDNIKGNAQKEYDKIAFEVTKAEEWRKENFNFIKNTVEYFKHDFSFKDVVNFDAEGKEKLEKALEVKSIDSLLKRFFKSPDQVKKCLDNNEPDSYWAQDRFEECDSLSNEGDKLANTIFNNIKETPIAKKCKEIKESNVEKGLSRALFECLQVNGNYDKFIEELRINLSFYIRDDRWQHLKKDTMKLKTEFRQKFVKFTTEIQKLRAEYNSKLQEYKKNHNNKIDTKDPEYQKIIAINEVANKKQNEMDEEFFSVKDFDFLKKEKIINENDFAQINNKVLEIASKKINDLDLKKLISEKKISSDAEKKLKLEIYNRFEDIIKNNPDISYEDFVARLNKEILICKYDGLEKTLFNMIWEFDLELKNNKNLENDYWDSMVIMRLYHLVQHFFHTAGILSDTNELSENDMREIALNMEDVRFYLKTNPKKLILGKKKSAVENLIIRLFKGTSLEENILDYIEWFKNGVNDFCQMTTEVIHITQSNGVSLATKNRQLRNGFFVNCDDGLIKNFCVPLQTLAELKENHNAEKFKPNIKEGVKLADPNEICDLTLSDDDWEILDEDQIFELSDKSFDILINTATYITPKHLKKLMDCWKPKDYVKKMEDHLLNTNAKESIFGLINKGERINDKNTEKNDGNEYKQELFPMIKELYKNCQQTSLENAIEFLKMQQKCHYGYSIEISLEDLKNDFDFAVESMNKVWFRVDKLNIKSSYSSDSYYALLDELDGILRQFDGKKFEPEGKEAQKKAMDSHPELILALYVLYYFGTKKYDHCDKSKEILRNIKNYEEEIFEFKDCQDFLDSISSKQYKRNNPRLIKMAEDFFTKLNEKNETIGRVIDNYKVNHIFSSKKINQEKEIKEDELKDFNNKINNIKGENNDEFQEKNNSNESYEDEKLNKGSVNKKTVENKNKNEINTSTEENEADNNNIRIDNNIENKNNDEFQGKNNFSESYQDEKFVKGKNKNEIHTKTEENEENKNKTPIITNYEQVIIDNYKGTNEVDQQNSKNNKRPNTKYNKKKIALFILTALIFLLLIIAIISMNPIFIKTMIAIAVIYITLIIILICYKDCVSKSEAQERIRFNNDMKGYGREIDKSLNLNYESDEKINITQQYTNDQENRFPSE